MRPRSRARSILEMVTPPAESFGADRAGFQKAPSSRMTYPPDLMIDGPLFGPPEGPVVASGASIDGRASPAPLRGGSAPWFGADLTLGRSGKRSLETRTWCRRPRYPEPPKPRGGIRPRGDASF